MPAPTGVVGGKVVHDVGDYASLAPAMPPVSPTWSPVRSYGGYQAARTAPSWSHRCTSTLAGLVPHRHRSVTAPVDEFGAHGCDSFAF